MTILRMLALAITLMLPIPAAVAASAAPPTDRADLTRYIEIPCEGGIGIDPFGKIETSDVVASGIRACMEYAFREKLEYAVLRIDSLGGNVIDAEQIAEVLGDPKYEEIITVALVDRAISAAIWITFSCDHIFVLDRSRQGAALSYRTSRSGSREYDAKANSTIAAAVASLAKVNGHNPAIARAMILPEAKLYAWTDANGTTQVSPSSPEESGGVQIDSATSILTLTSEEAVKFGVARGVVRSAADLGDALGIQNWRDTGVTGIRLMRAELRDLERTEQKRAQRVARVRDELRLAEQRITEGIPSLVREAERLHPERSTYSRDRRGYFTPESQVRWRSNADNCRAKWSEVARSIRSIAGDVKDARDEIEELRERYSRDELYHVFALRHESDLQDLDRQVDRILNLEGDMESILSEANTMMRWMRNNRTRT